MVLCMKGLKLMKSNISEIYVDLSRNFLIICFDYKMACRIKGSTEQGLRGRLTEKLRTISNKE